MTEQQITKENQNYMEHQTNEDKSPTHSSDGTSNPLETYRPNIGTQPASYNRRISNPTPQVAAMYAEEDGNYREAARLYKLAGDIAGGHTHAANMYNKAQECIAKTPDDPTSNP